MKGNYNDLSHKADEMRIKTNDEIISFMLKKSNDNVYNNSLMNVSTKEMRINKFIDKALSILLVISIIYAMIMIPYIFFNGYPY